MHTRDFLNNHSIIFNDQSNPLKPWEKYNVLKTCSLKWEEAHKRRLVDLAKIEYYPENQTDD